MKKIILGVVIIILITSVYFWWNNRPTDMADHAADQETAATSTTNQSATSTNTTKPEPITFEMKSGGFYFEPNILRVKVGQEVRVKVDTVGNMHTFTIDELGLDVKTPGGKITEVVFTPDKTGSFVFYCAMAGHRQKGQWGTLIVE